MKSTRVSYAHKLLLVTLLLALVAALVLAQPTPHNIAGRILNNGTTSNGVENGVVVYINNTVLDEITTTQVFAPPIPPLKGSYSATIQGSDGDVMQVLAWNITNWGETHRALQSGTTTINVILNNTRDSEPNVTIVLPANNSVIGTPEFNVTALVTMMGADATGCVAVLNFTQNEKVNITGSSNHSNALGSVAIGSPENTTWNVTVLNEGAVNITVSTSCDNEGRFFNNINFQHIRLEINDTTPPYIVVHAPANNSWVQPNVTFHYTATDLSGLQNCSLYINETLNQTIDTPNSGTPYQFTLNNTQHGETYSWFLSCFDASSRENQGNTSTFFFQVDGIPPVVTLFSPANTSVMISYLQQFQYNATDNFNVTNCTLLLNNVVRHTNLTIFQNVTNNFTESIPGNTYNWTVSCSDPANNIGTAGSFLLRAADLLIKTSDLLFSNNNPTEFEEINITAYFYNNGTANTTSNVTVRFFENDPDNGGTQIGEDFQINVTTLENVTLIQNYTAKPGFYEIHALIDPPIADNGSIIEENESNNIANRTLLIPANHIFYGQVIGDVFLDTLSNLTILTWEDAINFNGNLYVADSDSVIDFTSLRAIGRNLSNNLTFNDFAEIDAQLGITNFTDSINRTYTANQQLRANISFSIFELNVTNVPIINSTNSSNFITGILWDDSDDAAGVGNGEYNGSEDLIFIARINEEALGQYGQYDYEVTVPANLRRYLTPDVYTTVSFYSEIT